MTEIRSYGQRTRSALEFPDDGRTKQSFADESDINTIMGHWRRTGHIEHLNKTAPRYGDFTNATDYLTAVNMVAEADEAFMALPAEVRARMNNSSAFLLGFLADPNNLDEAVQLGLVEPPTPTPPLGDGSSEEPFKDPEPEANPPTPEGTGGAAPAAETVPPGV